MTQQPQAKYRHDYRAPEYLISDIDLTFDLDAAKTVVTVESKVSRHAAASDVHIAPGRRRSDPDRSAGERPAVE